LSTIADDPAITLRGRTRKAPARRATPRQSLTQRASIPPWTRAEIPAHASLVTDDSRFDGERALTDFLRRSSPRRDCRRLL